MNKMNKADKTDKETPAFGRAVQGYLRGKWKDFLLIGVLAVLLLFAISRVFDGKKAESAPVSMTETEEKISRLLQEIEGVGDAEVIVCETENGEKSVVIVCEGAKNIRVVLNVREAVATALGTEQSSVKIYQKK